jgi:hypothetical protein
MSMTMKRLPDEFEGLLSARGKRILAGADAACGALGVPEGRLVAIADALDGHKAASALALLEATLPPLLESMDEPIPPETITRMEANYDEWLPKSVRVKTAYFDSKREKAWETADRIGLVRMLGSESFRAFAAQLAGRPLRAKRGMQLLCYGPGDYTGPHNDHHPEEVEARDGYVDVHVSLTTPAVAHHFLVYEEAGHLSRMMPVHTLGGVTAYRLPFWHYTTPLVARTGRGSKARRWLLLGTFLFDRRGGKRRADEGPLTERAAE